MFIGSPKHYFYNPAFEVKMVLLLAAILVQALLFRKVAHSEHPNPWLARASAAAPNRVAELRWPVRPNGRRSIMRGILTEMGGLAAGRPFPPGVRSTPAQPGRSSKCSACQSA